MADLRANLANAGLQNVRTYIQSGNVIFEHEAHHPKELAKQIHDVISEHNGFQVPVIVITAAQFSDVFSSNPFLNERNEDVSKLHVTFLSEKPRQKYLDKIAEVTHPPDECIIRDKVVYLYCPDGYGRTKFTNNFFEHHLNVTASTRNWKTMIKLHQMLNQE